LVKQLVYGSQHGSPVPCASIYRVIFLSTTSSVVFNLNHITKIIYFFRRKKSFFDFFCEF